MHQNAKIDPKLNLNLKFDHFSKKICTFFTKCQNWPKIEFSSKFDKLIFSNTSNLLFNLIFYLYLHLIFLPLFSPYFCQSQVQVQNVTLYSCAFFQGTLSSLCWGKAHIVKKDKSISQDSMI